MNSTEITYSYSYTYIWNACKGRFSKCAFKNKFAVKKSIYVLYYNSQKVSCRACALPRRVKPMTSQHPSPTSLWIQLRAVWTLFFSAALLFSLTWWTREHASKQDSRPWLGKKTVLATKLLTVPGHFDCIAMTSVPVAGQFVAYVNANCVAL